MMKSSNPAGQWIENTLQNKPIETKVWSVVPFKLILEGGWYDNLLSKIWHLVMWCKHPDDASTVMYFMLSTLWMASLKISGLGLVKWLSILPALSPGKSLTTRPQNTSNIHVQQRGLRKKGAPGGEGGARNQSAGNENVVVLKFHALIFFTPQMLMFLMFWTCLMVQDSCTQTSSFLPHFSLPASN